jgi:hypothetical protein
MAKLLSQEQAQAFFEDMAAKCTALEGFDYKIVVKPCEGCSRPTFVLVVDLSDVLATGIVFSHAEADGEHFEALPDWEKFEASLPEVLANVKAEAEIMEELLGDAYVVPTPLGMVVISKEDLERLKKMLEDQPDPRNN